jgi:hypothetical protein
MRIEGVDKGRAAAWRLGQARRIPDAEAEPPTYPSQGGRDGRADAPIGARDHGNAA